MKITDTNKNKQKQQNRPMLKPVSAPRDSLGNRAYPNGRNQIISGYFVQDKTYKEMAISRLNSSLCMLLAFLVGVCIVSYYFVTLGEIELNKIRKTTLALNYENDEMQNSLDNMQSYYNVDKTVSKTNILGPAKQVIELNAKDTANIKTENKKKNYNPSWSMGY